MFRLLLKYTALMKEISHSCEKQTPATVAPPRGTPVNCREIKKRKTNRKPATPSHYRATRTRVIQTDVFSVL